MRDASPGFLHRACRAAAALLIFVATAGAAQSPGADTAGAAGAAAAATVTRDPGGPVTLRAVRVAQPLLIDGQLDEPIYTRVPGAGGFVQQEPREGQPATERTDVWIFFDDRNVYVAARCWDSSPDRWVVNELQRDGDVTNNENISVQFDTFHDRRNGFMFQTTPAGALRDVLFTDEGNVNGSWNTVWTVKSGRFDGGWTVEMAIPFKSIRYGGAGPQEWGVSFRRIVKWKNEMTHLVAMPRAFGFNAAFRASSYATLVGLETPSQTINLEVKPYVNTSVTTDRRAAVPFSNDPAANVGLDFKYGLSRSLTTDFTYNTDFAQVEEDVQQVNLTRFSLFFPEKREFFLEGQGIFAFGGAQVGGGGGGGGNNDVPILFFSRRIGLSQGQAVPVLAGGRLTGRSGRYTLGAIDIETDDKPSARAVATNFSVLRVKRDILRRSAVGVLATHRSTDIAGRGSNTVFGLDANMQFFRNVSLTSYVARTDTAGRRGRDLSYRGRFDYNGDRYGLQAERLMVGANFNPEVGFTRRIDFRRDTGQVRFSPRPRNNRLVRRYVYQANYDYITDGTGEVKQNTEAQATFRTEFQNSDQYQLEYTRAFEFLPQAFEIAPGVVLPSGPYRYQFLATQYNFGQQRMIAGRVSASRGTFYDGTRTEFGVTGGRVNLSRYFSMEPGLTLNWIDLPAGRFSNRLVTTRTIVSPSARMALSSLLQFNGTSHTLSGSVRLRWEYTPGSELFVVYTEGRDTLPTAPVLMNRAFVVKVTRLFRM